MTIYYKIKTANEDEIFSHLWECNNNFIPLLSSRVDIKRFTRKIFENTVTFEAWSTVKLTGLLSAYFNDTVYHTGYINHASVIKEYMGKGIATELLSMCIEYAIELDFTEIKLEVSTNNGDAIRLYRRNGFYEVDTNGEFIRMKRDININHQTSGSRPCGMERTE